MAYVRSGSQQPTGNAVAGDVKSGRIFSNENDVDLVGTFAAQEKTVTAGTSAASVTPDSGKYLSKVTYNPTPSQAKSVNPSTSAQTVSPDSGKLLSRVSVGAIQTETKTVTPTTSSQNVTPTSGKFLTRVTVNAISTQTKTVTASRSNQTVTPDSGKYLSQVTVNKYPDASGTYVPTGADLNNNAADMGATNNLRFVNTATCYNQGHSDGYNQGIIHECNNRAGYNSAALRNVGDQMRCDLYAIKAGTHVSIHTTNTAYAKLTLCRADGNVIHSIDYFSDSGPFVATVFEDTNIIIYIEKIASSQDASNFWYWYELGNSNY